MQGRKGWKGWQVTCLSPHHFPLRPVGMGRSIDFQIRPHAFIGRLALSDMHMISHRRNRRGSMSKRRSRMFAKSLLCKETVKRRGQGGRKIQGYVRLRGHLRTHLVQPKMRLPAHHEQPVSSQSCPQATHKTSSILALRIRQLAMHLDHAYR